MRRNTLLVAIAALSVMLISGVALARGQGHGSNMVPDELQLSAEQQQQIEAIYQSHSLQFTALGNQVRDLNVAIDNELAKQSADMARIERFRSERSMVNEQKMMLQYQVRAEIDNVLTPEQREYYGEHGMRGLGLGHGSGMALHNGMGQGPGNSQGCTGRGNNR
ncbi:MAG: periplasmic heavy metal sensor [Candidatus Alcyoniella australis]|nr:periplasmic heavy metal sensor [Candidatus Alcyoniella australis]